MLYLTQMASDNYLLLATSSYLSMFCMPRYQFRRILDNVFRAQILIIYASNKGLRLASKAKVNAFT